MDHLHKIEAINKILENRFGLRIEVGSIESMTEVCRHYDDKRKLYLQQMVENDALKQPEYAKAVLISEGLRMLLREIKPSKRKKPKKN